MSPTTNTSGWPGRRAVRQDRNAAGPVQLGAGGLGQLGRQRRGLDPGRPERRVGCPAGWSFRPRRRVDAVGIDAHHPGPHAQLHAEPLELLGRLA